MITITDHPIVVEHVTQLVQSGLAGGVTVFIGTVRNHSGTRKVLRLEYEAYGSMAEKTMREIAEEARARWQLISCAIVHRTGTLQIGEVAVVVAVSAPHRQATFEACQYVIDTVKERVPIWKKEFYEDGQVWVAAHP